MQRITISISDGLSSTLEDIRIDRGYQSRSEAVRDLVRDGIERWREESAASQYCVATLSYVFDRRIRALAQRLADMQHEHHNLVVSTTSVRLDHFHTMETIILRGATSDVRAFADKARAERGVRSGSINLLRVEAHDDHDHEAGGHHEHEGHAHLSPLN